MPVTTIEITEDMKRQALQFATDIINSNNQYTRLLPAQIRQNNNLSNTQRLEIQRTYMGKLAELAFAELLTQNNKFYDPTGMFDIYEGQNNVDTFDFMTANNHTVDIKAGFRQIHKRLLINTQQFNNLQKDYYVGVKLNAEDLPEGQTFVDINSVTQATIYGYATAAQIQQNNNIQNFGEGNAYWLWYGDLQDINQLVGQFRPL